MHLKDAWNVSPLGEALGYTRARETNSVADEEQRY